MHGLLKASNGINAALTVIGRIAGWLFLANMVVICFDVVTRRIGFQLPDMGSTRLQELEWHLHAALFSLWLGLTYLRDGHVRIDVFVSGLRERTKQWIELVGCFVFAFPYCAVVIYFGWDFFLRAYDQNEGSDAPTGLPMRWIIKLVLFIGLLLLASGVASVAMRRIVYLFGPPELRPAVERH